MWFGCPAWDLDRDATGRRSSIAELYRNLYSKPVSTVDLRLSITEAARRGVSGLVAAASEVDIILERHGEPVAAMIGMNRIEALEEARADLRDLALVLSRVATDSGDRVPFDDLLGTFGLSREELDALPDED